MATPVYVNFSNYTDLKKMDGDLAKELKAVESLLNLSPTENVNGSYVSSPVNVAVNKYPDFTIRSIKMMVMRGLSFVNRDYYVMPSYGGKPEIKTSPNGMILAMNKLAGAAGFIANINTGCVFTGYEKLIVKRDGLFDSIELINSAESEIKQVSQNDIIAPYCLITLIEKKTLKTISSKLTIVRNNEYKAARSASSKSKSPDAMSSTHRKYPVPMATKIPLHRAAREMMAALGYDFDDDSNEAENLREFINETIEEAKENQKPKEPENKQSVTDEDKEIPFDVFASGGTSSANLLGEEIDISRLGKI